MSSKMGANTSPAGDPSEPSKYNDECTHVREATGAQAAVVIVIGGARGSGMAMQAEHEHQDAVVAALPGVLRRLADAIEADAAARGAGVN